MTNVAPVLTPPKLATIEWIGLDGGDIGVSTEISGYSTLILQSVRVSGSGTSGVVIQTSNDNSSWFTVSTGATSSSPDIGAISGLGKYLRAVNNNSPGTVTSVYLTCRP